MSKSLGGGTTELIWQLLKFIALCNTNNENNNNNTMKKQEGGGGRREGDRGEQVEQVA